MANEMKRQTKLVDYDDSVFSSTERVALPPDDAEYFVEEQRFDQIWLWAIMGIQLLIVMIPLILTGQDWWSIIIAFLAIVLGMALLGSLSLRTRMDEEGVHFKMKLFHWRERTIPWDDIEQIHVREYSPVSEYGGWGMKYGRSGWAYNVRGNHGIQILKKNGKRILIGTQRPEEVAEYLDGKPLLV